MASERPIRARETNPNILKIAVLPKVNQRVEAMGEIVFRSSPALLDHYTKILVSHFETLGRPFSEEELAKLKKLDSRVSDSDLLSLSSAKPSPKSTPCPTRFVNPSPGSWLNFWTAW